MSFPAAVIKHFDRSKLREKGFVSSQFRAQFTMVATSGQQEPETETLTFCLYAFLHLHSAACCLGLA